MIVQGVAYLLTVLLDYAQGPAIADRLILSGESANRLGVLLHPLGTTHFSIALFVVLTLWSLGGRLETRFGMRHLLALYVLCNVVAGAIYLAVARGLPALATKPLDFPAGALAGFCVVAILRLRDEVLVVFGRVTSAAKLYAIGGIIVIVLAVADGRAGAVAWLAAVVAGGLGAWLVEYGPALVQPRQYRARRVVRPSVPRPVAPPTAREEPDIDDILAKISREGIASLTDEERERLEAARQAKLRK